MMMTTKLRKGSTVTMTDDALNNYGEQWRNVQLKITHVATAYMPASEFYDRGQPEGFHPGFDIGAGSPLYDLRETATGKALGFSLYGWEVE